MIRRIFLLNYCGESRCHGNLTKISILVFCIAFAIEKVLINKYLVQMEMDIDEFLI